MSKAWAGLAASIIVLAGGCSPEQSGSNLPADAERSASNPLFEHMDGLWNVEDFGVVAFAQEGSTVYGVQRDPEGHETQALILTATGTFDPDNQTVPILLSHVRVPMCWDKTQRELDQDSLTLSLCRDTRIEESSATLKNLAKEANHLSPLVFFDTGRQWSLGFIRRLEPTEVSSAIAGAKLVQERYEQAQNVIARHDKTKAALDAVAAAAAAKASEPGIVAPPGEATGSAEPQISEPGDVAGTATAESEPPSGT